MNQWVILRVGISDNNYFEVAPQGRIDLNDLLPKPKEIINDKVFNADKLRFENYFDAIKARHFLLDILGNNGWEPFAVDRGDIYFKRIRS